MWRFVWAMFAAISFSSAVQATTNPLSTPSGQCFNSLEAAALSALDSSQSQSTTLEYEGAIYWDGDSYCTTSPVTNGSKDDFQVRIGVQRALKS